MSNVGFDKQEVSDSQVTNSKEDMSKLEDVPIENNEAEASKEMKTNKRKKVPRRIIHFSDGIVEEFSTDSEEEEEERRKAAAIEEGIISVVSELGLNPIMCFTLKLPSLVIISMLITEKKKYALLDPKTLKWLPWMIWYTWFMGSTALSYCDYVGEKLAWWFGITSPKYYYELEEFKRMQEEEKEAEEKRKVDEHGWTNVSSSEIVTTPNVNQNPSQTSQPSLKG